MKHPRIDILRDRDDGRYHWRVEDVTSKAYSRRIDCFAQAGRILGFDSRAIEWFNQTRYGAVDTSIYDYGQVRLADGHVLEVFVWKRWWRR